MNPSKVIFTALCIFVIGVVVYQHHEFGEIRGALFSLGKDRDALEQQVESLTRLMMEARAREAQATPRAAAGPGVAVVAQAVAPPAADRPIPGVTTKAPAGWSKNGSKPGSYAVGVDQNQMYGGQPSAYVKSLDASTDGFGGMMQTASSEDFAGKRVRLSGWMKTEDADDGGGHLWLRVDGQQVGVPLQFDNMNNRAPKGTTDWQQYSVVLDVPPESSALAYGFFLQGGGKMWVNGTKLEPVGADVSSTNMVTAPAKALPEAPVNLGFAP
jgi:hypothetical protein